MQIYRLALIIIVTWLTSGCATNTMTGRSQLIIVSEAAAINKSSSLYSSMIDAYDKDSKLSGNTEVNERVLNITNRLVEKAVLYKPDAQKWKWQVNVIESEEINAFCMAGGKMAVYTGLLEKINPTDDELAQVMGHEIAHALANHTAEKMSVDILTQIAVATATVAVAASGSGSQQQRSNNTNAAQNVAVLAGAAFVTLPNSRGAETEADKLGIEIAAQAGYNPAASVTLWEKMMEATGDKSKGDFLSTHPSSLNRIEALKVLQEPMAKIYQERLPLYANYVPAYQYVRSSKDSAGFSSSNVRVIEEGKTSLVEPPVIDSTKAIAFYSADYDAFKQGNLEMKCATCSLKFYLNQKDLKVMHDKQDWRGLVQSLIKIGYEFDLSYYYLAAAANGLGYKESAEKYLTKAKELSAVEKTSCELAKMIKCTDVVVSFNE
ncbi:MAG: M48 family metallopeptidase [Methylophilus sp.]|nr:M48 family metallopeptidase [Methylophilus sp.]